MPKDPYTEMLLQVDSIKDSINESLKPLANFVGQIQQQQSAIESLINKQETMNQGIRGSVEVNGLLEQSISANTRAAQNYDLVIQGLYHNLQDNNDSTTKLQEQFSSMENVLKEVTKAAQTLSGTTTTVNIDTSDLTKTLKRNNKTVIDLIDTIQRKKQVEEESAKATERATKAVRAADEWEKQYRESLDKTEESFESLNIRTKIYKQALRTLADEQGIADKNMASFNLGMKSFTAYTKAGGTSLEYFAKILTGTEENVKILGFEATSVRRVMYGFLPPGMFRLVNKTSTALNAIGGVMRKLRPESEETSTGFSKLFGAMMPSQKDINRINDRLEVVKGEYDSVFEQVTKNEKKLKGYNLLEAADTEGKKSRIERDYGISRDDDIETEKAVLERKITVGREEGSGLQQETRTLTDKRNRMQKGAGKFFRKFDIFNKRSKWLGKRSTSELFKTLSKSRFKIVRVFGFIGMIVQLITKIFLIITVAILAIGGFVLFFKEFGAEILAAGSVALDVVMFAFNMIMNGVGDFIDGIMGFFEAIMEGDFQEAIEHIGQMLMGVGQIVVGLIIGVFGTVVTFVTGLVVEYWGRLKEWLDNVTVEEYLGTIVSVVLGILAGIIFLTLLPVQVPIWIGIGVVLLAALLGKKLAEPIEKAVGEIGDFLGFKAKGGEIDTPLTVVGEKGPELIKGGQGSTVYSNNETNKMLSGGSSKSNNITNNFNITVNAKDTSDAEMRRLSQRIGKLIMIDLNRNMSGTIFSR